MAKQKSKSKSAATVNKVKLARPVKLVRKPLRKARTYVRPVGRAALRKVASRKVGKIGKLKSRTAAVVKRGVKQGANLKLKRVARPDKSAKAKPVKPVKAKLVKSAKAKPINSAKAKPINSAVTKSSTQAKAILAAKAAACGNAHPRHGLQGIGNCRAL